jgi:NTP pyrophosphatase (non-canonical NTP hydrolase)
MASENLNLNTYQSLAMRTAKELPFSEALIHAALGLTSEAGEYASAIKANVVYGRRLDDTNLFEELGDILWFVAYAAHAQGFDLEDVAKANIQKLRTRYPGVYSDADAIARADKVDESS